METRLQMWIIRKQDRDRRNYRKCNGATSSGSGKARRLLQNFGTKDPGLPGKKPGSNRSQVGVNELALVGVFFGKRTTIDHNPLFKQSSKHSSRKNNMD